MYIYNNKKILTLTSLFLIIDIIVKIIIKNNLILNESIPIIKEFFYITYTRNTGAAWSILAGKQLFLIIITLIILMFLIKYLIKKKKYSSYEIYGYSMLLGGTIGNLIDRIIYGYVIDYLEFHIMDYIFPIFNIADSCIVIGIMLLFIDTWRK